MEDFAQPPTPEPSKEQNQLPSAAARYVTSIAIHGPGAAERTQIEILPGGQIITTYDV